MKSLKTHILHVKASNLIKYLFWVISTCISVSIEIVVEVDENSEMEGCSYELSVDPREGPQNISKAQILYVIRLIVFKI